VEGVFGQGKLINRGVARVETLYSLTKRFIFEQKREKRHLGGGPFCQASGPLYYCRRAIEQAAQGNNEKIPGSHHVGEIA